MIKGSVWSLQESQLDAIKRLKEVLTTAPVLSFYNFSQPIRISVDASSHGLGAVLEQQGKDTIWKPVGFASRTLTPTERKNAHIEKETLAIIFACEKFHQYLYGRSFVVISDHRPLKSIFSKSLTQCPPRIQRFTLRLQKYHFDLDFEPGKRMDVSDVLSVRILMKQSQKYLNPKWNSKVLYISRPLLPIHVSSIDDFVLSDFASDSVATKNNSNCCFHFFHA